MRLILFLLASIMASVLVAQDEASSLFWRMEAPHLHKASFLYGTVHSKDDRAYTYAEQVVHRMDSVSTVAGELDPGQVAGSGLSLMSAMLLPEGKSVEDLYPRKKDRALVSEGMQRQLGAMAGMFSRMKPFFIMATITEAAMPQHNAELLDEYLLGEAARRGRHVIGLETMAEQLRAIDVLSLDQQAEMLLDHFKRNSYRDDLDRLLDAYEAQDLALLVELGDASGELPEELERALIADRNAVMAHRMDSVLHADGSALFLVGALHLPGREGLIALLREAGFSMQPVPMAPDLPGSDSPPDLLAENGIRYVNDTLGFRMNMPVMPRVLAKGDGAVHGWVLQSSKDPGTLNVSLTVGLVPDGRKDLDAFIGQDVPADESAVIEKRAIQGVEAYLMLAEEAHGVRRILYIMHQDRSYKVEVNGADPGAVQVAIDSFRFTDRPE